MLKKFMADAMEPDYVDLATRSGGPAPTASRARRTGLRVAVVLVLLTAGFVLALTVSNVRRAAPDAATARTELAAQVQQRTILSDDLAAEITRLRGEVDQARDARLAETRAGRTRREALAELELAAGTVPVRGPGVRVTVTDAPPRVPDGTPSTADLGRVQDRDLQVVVNGLWNAGAEAISVGGYRLTSRTAIRTAGEAILVDFRPIVSPYVVEAIGGDSLRTRFLDGPGGRALNTLSSMYGIRSTATSVGELELPAAVLFGQEAARAQGTATTRGAGS